MENLASTPIDRRAFLETALKAMFAGVVIQIFGCGTESSSDYPAGSKPGTVVSNHGHIVFVTAAQLNTGLGVTLDIQGNATHNHQLVLSDAEVQAIANGDHVATTTLSGGSPAHTHGVTFN